MLPMLLVHLLLLPLHLRFSPFVSPPHFIPLFLVLILLLLFFVYFFSSLRPYTIHKYICIKPFMYIKSYVPFYVHMKSHFNGVSR